MSDEEQEATSEWWQWVKQNVWEQSFGDEKTSAINSMAALRNSLQTFAQALNQASTEGKANLPQTQESIEGQLQQMQDGLGEYVSEG
jgi:hypothetical protein